jgi:hypothetical protein
MKKVIHIEDNPEWQNNVGMALAKNREIESFTYGSMEEFRQANYPSADLYVCDRHLPDKRGQNPNDDSWKRLLETITCLHPGIRVPIVILSSHPPRDWRRYANVVDAVQKTPDAYDFDIGGFGELIAKHLCLDGGSK